MFVWQFVLNLTICVIAYARILQVIRRQRNVNPSQRRTVTVAVEQPVAGPSGMTERDKAAVGEGSKAKAGTSSQNQGGRSSSTMLSKAKINVIRTMILILICFVICYFPNDFYILYKTLTVFAYLQ